MLRYFCSVLMLFSLATPIYAKGSSKPKAPAAVAMPSLKRLVAIQEVRTNDVLGGGFDELQFALLLREQFSHALVNSKRYVDVPLESDDSQLDLDVALIAFEVVSKKGVKFGFNPIQGFLPIGVGFSAQVQKILVSFRIAARDPLSRRIVASVQVSAEIKDKSSSLSLRYLDFIDAAYNSQKRSPLSQVTGTALRQGVENLARELQPIPWEGRVQELRVLSDGRVFVRVNVGRDVNLNENTRLLLRSSDPNDVGFFKGEILIESVSLSSAWGLLTSESSVLDVADRARALPQVGDRVFEKTALTQMRQFLK